MKTNKQLAEEFLETLETRHHVREYCIEEEVINNFAQWLDEREGEYPTVLDNMSEESKETLRESNKNLSKGLNPQQPKKIEDIVWKDFIEECEKIKQKYGAEDALVQAFVLIVKKINEIIDHLK